MNIILIGFKNCGKTTVGKMLAHTLNYQFIDTDTVLEKYYFKQKGLLLPSYKIHHQEGEVKFREIEKSAINTLLSSKKTIIATGGGSILDKDNVNFFRRIGKIIYLYVSQEVLFERIMKGRLASFLDPKNPEKSFQNMFEARKDIYENVADYQVDTFDKTNDEIVEEIVKLV